MRKWIPAVLVLFAGCGYKHYPVDDSFTFDVPFIQGDKDGQLTSLVVEALSKSPFLQYNPSHSQLKITAKIQGNEFEQIGYQYRMQDNDSAVQHRLVPNEGRRTIKVEFTIQGLPNTKPLSFQIHGSSEFDFVDPDSFKDLAFYTPEGQLRAVLDFSLGQLDSEEGAKLASFGPAYKEIAWKFHESLSRYLEARRGISIASD